MVRKYHRDVSPPDCAEYTRRFIEVQEAYETLSDPRRGCVSLSPPGGGLMSYVVSGFHYAEYGKLDDQSYIALEERPGWKIHQQDQLAELKRRSVNKDSGGNLSWGARARRQRAES
ncbi:unnamed protein product [Musa hybrid cultivar]